MDRTDLPLISSENVQGTNVYSPDGSKIGEVDHLMIDKGAGKVSYAVMSFGGFLGLGSNHYPLPWAALKYNTELGGYQTGVTESQLKGAPPYVDGAFASRDWEANVHTHYGVQPYWG
jgi:sporulation protein YlmC with PRC-barrel domain